ncbi:MAG: phosphoadenylyl-sulfate reductase [Candidatus Bathyarchaeia archaeon]
MPSKTGPNDSTAHRRGLQGHDQDRFEKLSAEELLDWAVERFYPKIGLASSFGAEDMVIIDLLSQSGLKAKIFTLDTGRLPQETYDLMDEVRSRYGVTIDVYFPDTSSAQKMVKQHGLNLFYQSVEFRKLCCEIRKVEPLGRALEGLDAWITGLRRDQSSSRASLLKVEEDTAHGGIIKINPLAEWTWTEVFDYVKENGVPYNRLHNQGFLSIGCAPCTRAVKPGESQRAGRWWWELEGSQECGLHYSSIRKPE